MRGQLISERLRRIASPLYGARRNAAEALEEIAGRDDEVVLQGSDLALFSGHPAGHSQRRAIGRLGTALWEVFPGHVALIDRDSVVVSGNRAWRQFGQNCGSLDVGLGANYLEVCDRAAAAGEAHAAEAADLVASALAGVAVERRLPYQVDDGRWFGMQAIPLPGRSAGALVVHIDITEDRESAEDWRHRALHDPLTGLPNRALLTDRLEHAVVAAARDPRSLAVLFVDMDAFKRVNDVYGHAIGDQVLREAAGRMAASVRTGDTIGRWGGDEFLVIAERLEHSAVAVDLANRLVASLDPPIDTAHGPLRVRASVGSAHLDQDWSGDQLVAAADEALQRMRDMVRAGQPLVAAR